MVHPGSARLFTAGSLLLGFSLGGLTDGVVLHEVLQWHNLLSSRVANDTVAGLRDNVTADGVFHLGTTVLLVVGLLLIWRAAADPRSIIGNVAALVGLGLIGWGTFHVVDQILFHVLLGLHDIREATTSPQLYNWGFFVIGLALVAAGTALKRTRGAPVIQSP